RDARRNLRCRCRGFAACGRAGCRSRPYSASKRPLWSAAVLPVPPFGFPEEVARLAQAEEYSAAPAALAPPRAAPSHTKPPAKFPESTSRHVLLSPHPPLLS